MSETLQKRGRKTGSADSVFIKLGTLRKYLDDERAIPVRRKFLEQLETFCGVSFVNETPATVVETTGEGGTNEEKLAASKDATIRQRLEIKEEELA